MTKRQWVKFNKELDRRLMVAGIGVDPVLQEAIDALPKNRRHREFEAYMEKLKNK